MNEPRRLKRVVIKEELVELTGDFVKAVLLQQMLYWSERVQDFKQLLRRTSTGRKNGSAGDVGRKERIRRWYGLRLGV